MGDGGGLGQAKAEHGSGCQWERWDQPARGAMAVGLGGEETRGEDMAQSGTGAEARSSQQAKDSAPLHLGRALAHTYD